VIDFNSDELHPINLAIGVIWRDRPISINIREMQKGQHDTFRIRDFTRSDGVVMAITWPFQGEALYDSADYSYEAKLDTNFTGIADGDISTPDKFELLGNYPNPFNSSSMIFFNWQLPSSNYTISVYDIGGRLINSQSGSAATGVNRIRWNARNDLAGGVYFYRLSVGEDHLDGKMLYLK
jgi:hypothetical protein